MDAENAKGKMVMAKPKPAKAASAVGAVRDRSGNKMRDLVVEKMVINIGTGSEENVNSNAKRLLGIITNGRTPSTAVSKKRNPAFKIAKGQAIGTFVTLRGQEIKPLADKMFDAVNHTIKQSSITDNSVSFGIHEYIDIRGVKYDPKIGMLGMNVNLSFKRKGNRVSLRKRKRSDIPKKHKVITREEIKEYLKRTYKVEAA